MVLTSAAATMSSWRNTIVTEVLVLLSLAGIGLPKGSAQLQLNGGYVQTHRQDYSDGPSRKAPKDKPPSNSANTPASYSPDNDFFYPAYTPPSPDDDFYYPANGPVAPSIIRSYYYDRQMVLGRPQR